MREPLFTARQLESLAKLFELNDYQKAVGRARFLMSRQTCEDAVAVLKEAAAHLEAYQTLKGSVAPPARTLKGARQAGPVGPEGEG